MTALYLMVAVCLLIAALLWAVIRGGKREVEAKARAEQAEATVEALHRANEGRNEAVADLRNGKTPAEIVAANSKKWGKRK